MSNNVDIDELETEEETIPEDCLFKDRLPNKINLGEIMKGVEDNE